MLQAALASRKRPIRPPSKRKLRRKRRRKRRKRKRKRRRKGRRRRRRKRKRKGRKRKKKARKRRRQRKRRKRRRRRMRRRRKPKVKTTTSQTVICVRGSQSLHVKNENVRALGGRKRRKRRRRRRRRRRRKRKRKRGKRKRRKKRKRKKKRKKTKKRKRKRRRKRRKRKRKKKNRRRRKGKRGRYKRDVDDSNILRLPKRTVVKIFSGVDASPQRPRTYFLTDHTVKEELISGEGAKPSLRELRSVVEAFDGRLRDEGTNRTGHRIGKRSVVGRGVRCYRVLNYARHEKGEWERVQGARRLVHHGELSTSVIENADVRVGAMLRAAVRRSRNRSPTVVLGRDGRTLRCTSEMMWRSDSVGARCRAVMRCEHGGRWTRVGRRRYRCRCPFGYGGPRCAHRVVRCPPGRSPCRNGGTCMEMPPSRRLRGRRRAPPYRQCYFAS